VAIVLGSAISLAYYLRVVAAVWLSAPDEARDSPRAVAPGTARPAIAGGSQEADEVLLAPSSRNGVRLGHGRRR
jgi:NADH-quinone oxidoreductase subunit N